MLSATQMDPTLQPKVEQADDLFIASFDRAIKTIDDDKLDEQDQSYQEQLSRKDLLTTALRNLKNKVVEEVKKGSLRAYIATNIAKRAEKLTNTLVEQGTSNDIKLEAIKDFQQLTALFGFTASRSIWHKAACTAIGMLIGAVIGAAIGFVLGFIPGFLIGLVKGAKLGFGVAATAAASKAAAIAVWPAAAVAGVGAIYGGSDDAVLQLQQHQPSNELGNAVATAAKSFIRTPGR